MNTNEKISRSHLSPQLLHLCNTCHHEDHHHHHHHPQRDVLHSEKDGDMQHGHCDSASFSDDTPLEFLSDSSLSSTNVSSDINLGLHDSEPESWSQRVGHEVSRTLKEIEVKRQEYINEFILTEKRHCITLLVMQKVFVQGLQRHFQLGPNLERMFPRLADLIELHLEFFGQLRKRQRQSEIVSTITDILERQFSSQSAQRLKCVYGEFCSRHKDAVEIYKDCAQIDPRFRKFVLYCQRNPLLEKKGIPECILFVTQRLTKYPLLVEALIKTSKENEKEHEALQRVLNYVKNILVDVNTQVAEKEKEERKLEIYNKIDENSYTIYRGLKFEKTEILLNNRKLKFEGIAMLVQGTRMLQVLVIVLSDILFFVQENSQKYSFFNPDNKGKVISLRKLMVRDSPAQESRIIRLISSNKIYELEVYKPKDKQVWIRAIRDAVDSYSKENGSRVLLSVENNGTLSLSRQTEAKHMTDSQPKLPINLISTSNQRKLPQNVEVKQQIPLKLASQLS